MRSLAHYFFMVLAACGGHAEKQVITTVPGYAPAGVDWSSMYGVLPEQPRPAPTFSATAQSGERRSEVDLVGHPTVIWFYPAAGTPG